MNITVFGATGALGTEIVKEGLKRNHQLTVLVRNPQKLGDDKASLNIITGDAIDKMAVAKAIHDADMVVSALGGPPKGTQIAVEELLQNATQNIVEAMTEYKVNRLLYVSAWGVGDSRGYTTAMFRYIIQPLAVKAEYANKEIQEQIVSTSNLNWTLVRPTILTNHSKSGYVSGRQLKFEWWHNIIPPMISRADVAQFILDESDDKSRYSMSPVMITGE
jgi:putative NADH-flavin reductase